MRKVHSVLDAALSPDRYNVSVVIPCYNYGDKLRAALESVLRQTYSPLEIEVIVVDDGSDEENARKTKAVAEEYGALYLRKDNGGVATARNLGIRVSIGAFICPLDADDEIAPTFLEQCIAGFKADQGLSLAYTGITTVFPDGSTAESAWPGEYDFNRFIRRREPGSYLLCF